MADSKKYDGSQWEHSLRKMTTASEIIVPPTTIYTDGSNITTYTIKGNTVQNGTPTPSNPIAVNGVGELVGSDYQIPISSGGVTTNIYLGSTQTVRQIKKYVFDGTENFANQRQTSTSGLYCFPILYSNVGMTDIINYDEYIEEIDYPQYKCTHFAMKPTPTAPDEFYDISDGEIGANSVANYGRNRYLIFCKSGITTTADFKTWLAAQYANGTPVTVYYILATAETATINEPLQKIGTYADTLSNAVSIPTTEGANSITVDTTVQPSEFTATWTGWHDASVKEKSENLILFDDLQTASSGTIYTKDSQGYSCPHFYTITLKPNTYYTMSTNYVKTANNNNIVYFEYADAENAINSENPVTIQTPETGILHIGYYSTRTGANLFETGVAYVMLNEGSTAKPYQPYWD